MLRSNSAHTLFFLIPFLWSSLCFSQEAKSKKSIDPVDAQVASLLNEVKGKSVGLLTNPTGVDNQLNQIADILFHDENSTLTAFFAPEHGLRGDQQAGGGVTDYIDPITGLPVYSVYSIRLAPTDEQLLNIDALIFDIQDVGVRFYTYVWTMTHAMEAAAKNGKEFIVFDRPNPIGCLKVEGAPNTVDYGLIGRLWPGESFGVATRHGMTVGELAGLVNGEWMDPKVSLKVIKIPGYARDQYFEDAKRPWVIPSPNMPTIDTATVYPGMCVFEGTNLSEGRGTTKPFEMVGAPFINGVELAAELNALGLPGVRFRPAYFKPSFDDYSGQFCGGIQAHVMDRETFDPIRTGLMALKTAYNKYPGDVNITNYASKLMGVPDLQNRIKTESVDDIIQGWQANLTAFKQMREKYLLYPVSGKSNGYLHY
ncbi:DUF1343 domain-containing protein [Candidatus Sumerlaeota bacterium]|nr:DUF1343 domain-containing protein [Candidatus Sumerlaeota bacterium]